MSIVRDIGSAFRLLTIVPLGAAEGEHPVRWFPLVGWVFGAIGVGIAAAGRSLGADAGGAQAFLCASVVVGAWALLCGMLHWDGLADSADGIGVRGDGAQRLEAMRGSATGAFGVTAIVLVALLQASALAILIAGGALWAIVAAPVIGRFGAAAALVYRHPARSDGLAAHYAGAETPFGALIMVLSLVPLVVLVPDWRSIVLGTGCVLASLAVPALFARRLGGITGDVLGATVLLSETLLLATAAALQGLL